MEHMDSLTDFYRGKRILITGAVGTVGRALTSQLAAMEPAELLLLDNNETDLFFMMEEYRGKNVNCILGDVRDAFKLNRVCEGVNIIIHAAALKHVILSEYHPEDVVQTNILGVQNIINAAVGNHVETVVFTSSDKAVNPTNVMGTSKLMGERLITAANSRQLKHKTVFCSTRFGNVIGSRGSVVPILYKKICQGQPVTVTDKRMTRFVMTVDEAARLVLKCGPITCGGEVFVTKMPVVRIIDLAYAMIELLAPRFGHDPATFPVEVIGVKPGEKVYEELLSEEELGRSLELSEMFAIIPAFKTIYGAIRYEYSDIISKTVTKTYVSATEQPKTKEWIKEYMLSNKVFDHFA